MSVFYLKVTYRVSKLQSNIKQLHISSDFLGLHVIDVIHARTGNNPPTILGISQALIGEQYPVWGSTIQERYGETRDGPRRATGMIKGMKKWTYEERLKSLDSELRIK